MPWTIWRKSAGIELQPVAENHLPKPSFAAATNRMTSIPVEDCNNAAVARAQREFEFVAS